MSDEECSICGLELKDKYTYELNCNHKYHYKCIDNWFEDNNSCPLCMKRF